MSWKKHVWDVDEILSSIQELHIIDLIEEIWRTFESQKQFFICGNGGSALNANHFAQDLSKGVIENGFSKPRIRAISLCNDIGFITATSNDDSYANIFVNQLIAFANEGDSLFVISGSGNSTNVIKAIEFANTTNALTISLTGKDGGKLSKHSQINLTVPSNDMLTIETMHLMLLHLLVTMNRDQGEPLFSY